MGTNLPPGEADPRTVNFIEQILDVEKLDLVFLTGDQLHHDILDSQSALFKVIAPIIARSVPFAAVFGNHDSVKASTPCRVSYTLFRYGLKFVAKHPPDRVPGKEQMSILQSLPFSLCQSGPKEVDGIGRFYVEILGPAPSQDSLSTLYFLDSHSQILSTTHSPDYNPTKQSQIDWFKSTCQAQRTACKDDDSGSFHVLVVF